MKSFIILLLLAQSFCLFAQNTFTPTTQEGVFEQPYYSKTVQDTYNIKVSIPFGYNQTAKDYPVLYVLDENIAFGMVNDIVKQLYFERNYPVIVVGIGYPNFQHWISRRQKDYTPSEENLENVKRFYKMLTTEVMPMVNKEFRTNSQNQFFHGHSSAALLGLYDFFSRKQAFHNYLLTSPSLNEDSGYLNDLEAQQFSLKRRRMGDIYFSIGNEEEANLKAAYTDFTETLASRNYPRVAIKNETLKGTHMSIMAIGFVEGFQYLVANQTETIQANWIKAFNQQGGFDNFYKKDTGVLLADSIYQSPILINSQLAQLQQQVGKITNYEVLSTHQLRAQQKFEFGKYITDQQKTLYTLIGWKKGKKWQKEFEVIHSAQSELPDTEKLVNQLTQAWEKRSNGHRPDLIVKELYVANGGYYFNQGKVYRGEEVTQVYQYMVPENFTIKLTPLSAYQADDLLITVGEFQTTGRGLYALIWKKVGDEWKLLLDFNF